MEFVDAPTSGLIQRFNQYTFSLMMIGAAGLVVGILPGVRGPTAMALVLPLICKMSAAGSFAFLLGMTAFTATPGSLRSSLPY
jgi:putative tricarboxylic transport membrane protein